MRSGRDRPPSRGQRHQDRLKCILHRGSRSCPVVDVARAAGRPSYPTSGTSSRTSPPGALDCGPHSPHNGQFVAAPVLVYRAMFAIFGIGHYWPFRLVGVVFEIAMLSVGFAYLHRRVPPFLALVAVGALMADGQAWQDILWPFELTFTISLASGSGALMILDRRDRFVDAFAALCLVIAVSSSGFGLVFIAGVGVEAAWSQLAARCGTSPTRSYQSPPLRRIWVIVPALTLYSAWYVSEHVHVAVFSGIADVPRSVAQSAGYGAGTLIGLHAVLVGEVLAAAIGLALAMRLVLDWRTAGRRGHVDCGSPDILDICSRWARGSVGIGAVTSRYLQPDSLFLVLALAELASPTWAERLIAIPAKWLNSVTAAYCRQLTRTGRRNEEPGRSRGPPTSVLPGSYFRNSRLLSQPLGAFPILGPSCRQASYCGSQLVSSAVTCAVEIAGKDLPSSFEPLPDDAPKITVGPYLAAVAALGSPADTNSQLLATLRSCAKKRRPTVDYGSRAISYANRARTRGRRACWLGFFCARVVHRSTPMHHVGHQLIFEPRRPTFLVVTPRHGAAEVRLRLLASNFVGPPNAEVAAGSIGLIRSRAAMALPVPFWHVQVTVEGQGGTCNCLSTLG